MLLKHSVRYSVTGPDLPEKVNKINSGDSLIRNNFNKESLP